MIMTKESLQFLQHFGVRGACLDNEGFLFVGGEIARLLEQLFQTLMLFRIHADPLGPRWYQLTVSATKSDAIRANSGLAIMCSERRTGQASRYSKFPVCHKL